MKAKKRFSFTRVLKNKRTVFSAVGISIIMAFTLVFGYASNNGVDISSPWLYAAFLLYFVLLFFLLLLLWQLLDNINAEKEKTNKSKRLLTFISSKKSVICTMPMFIICWLPFWLAAWPGFFCYDAEYAYSMFAGDATLFNSQPILHTELLGGFISLGNSLFGSYNGGIALYFLFQVIVLSAVFSFILRFEAKSGVAAPVVVLTFLWFALFPTCVMHSLCSTKDGLFSAAGLVFVILSVDYFNDTDKFLKSRKKILVLIAAIVIVMLYRKNAVYAFAVFSITAVIFIPKKKKIITAGISVICFIVYISSSMGLLVVFNGYPLPQTFDLLCVPCQQIARVYNEVGEDAFVGDDKETLENMFVKKDQCINYYETNADPIKGAINYNYCNENKERIARLLINTVKKYPKICVEAFLINSYQSWYPGAPITAYQRSSVKSYAGSESSYFECRVENPGTLDSKIPSLFDYMWHISRDNGWQDIPVVSLLYTIGFQLWVFLFFFGYIVSSSKSRLAVPLLFPLLVFLTVLLGPTALVRYSLMLFWGVPIWITTAHKAKNKHLKEADS